MGEKDVGGSRMVSEQPYLGVLFKSQNNSTWIPYDFEDLSSHCIASFSTNVNGKVTLVNDALPSKMKEMHYNSLHPLQTLRLLIVTTICTMLIVMSQSLV